jgi:hypothetical protein
MDRNEQATDEFIQRLVAAAPDLTEEQIANIRRLSLGDVPTGRKERPQAIDLG